MSLETKSATGCESGARLGGDRWVQAPDEASGLPEHDLRGRPGRVAACIKWLTAAVGLLTCIAAFVWATYQFLLTSPRFAIRHVDVEGNQRFSDEDVMKLAELRLGANLLGTDLYQSEQRLLSEAWIQQAHVTRELPDRVRISVREREALAVAAVGPELMLVSEQGELFKRATADDPYDLPIVTGLSEGSLATDRERELQRLAEGLAVLRQYGRLAVAGKHPLQEVALRVGGSVSLVVGNPPLTLHLGTGPWRRKLAMATEVLGSLGKRGQRPGIVFLDNERHPERVVVRMR